MVRVFRQHGAGSEAASGEKPAPSASGHVKAEETGGFPPKYLTAFHATAMGLHNFN